MGKLGRIACIATPMVLTVASLVCLLFVFLGGINRSDSTLRDLYFFKANLTSLKDNVTNTASVFDNTGINPSVLSALKAAVASNKIADYYDIYMWNYCSGDNNSSTPSFCSARQAEFYFNPLEVWGLNGTTLEALLPTDLKNGVSTYEKVSKWMFIAYAVAFWTTLATIIIGLFATCSRWGSFFTSIIASVSTLFTVLSAITSTALFSTIVGTFDSVLKPYDIKLTLGTSQLALDWLAVAFSIAATLFWIISICCCSGKSPHSHRKPHDPNQKYSVKRQPTFPFLNRGYSKLGEEQHGLVGQEYGQQPFGAPPQRDLEMQDYAHSEGPYKGREGAYEPFRHQRDPSAVSDVADV